MAFKRWNRSPSKKTPVRSWQSDEMKIIGWCLNKDIGVGISPDWKNDMSKWKIEISINKNTHVDPGQYSDDDVLNKVVEYYKYYYDKYNKQ
jgi:hypothetical protein